MLFVRIIYQHQKQYITQLNIMQSEDIAYAIALKNKKYRRS